MAITVDNPTTAPALTYDKLAFTGIHITWDDLNGPVSARITAATYATDENGTNYQSALTARLPIADLFSLAVERATDGKGNLATALSAVLLAAEELFREQQLLGLGET